jgi:hypothetical protein
MLKIQNRYTQPYDWNSSMEFLRVRPIASVALAIITLCTIPLVTGCGGGSTGSGSGSGSGSTGTTIQYKVTGATPSVAVVQVNGGAWTTLAFSGSSATFTVPTATSTYAVALLCPVSSGEVDETIYETSASDTVSPTSGACSATPTLATTNVTYNVSAVGGLNELISIGGYGGSATGASSSANITGPTGTQDIVLAARGGPPGIPLGVQFKRGVNITGAPVTFSPMTTSDATGSATVVVNGVPSGYTDSFLVDYFTAGGTSTLLSTSGGSTTYATVAAADTQSGDSYLIWPTASNSSQTSFVAAELSSSSAQNTTLTLPAVFTYNGPTAAAYPTFNTSYNGFTITAQTGWYAKLRWTNGATSYQIAVNATSAFLGSNPVSIPNLSSISGFPTPQASGGTVNWYLNAFTKTLPFFGLLNTPLNENMQYAGVNGSYVEP